MSVSWVRGPRKPQTAVSVTLGPWVPKTHPSPLIADVYALGRYWITRRTGEAHYDLYSPDNVLPIASGSLTALREQGEDLWRREQAQDLEQPGDAPTDVVVSDQGSIVLVLPRTEQAREWLNANVDSEAQWFGQSLVVERRFISYLIEGMMEEGLRISA